MLRNRGVDDVVKVGHREFRFERTTGPRSNQYRYRTLCLEISDEEGVANGFTCKLTTWKDTSPLLVAGFGPTLEDAISKLEIQLKAISLVVTDLSLKE